LHIQASRAGITGITPPILPNCELQWRLKGPALDSGGVGRDQPTKFDG